MPTGNLLRTGDSDDLQARAHSRDPTAEIFYTSAILNPVLAFTYQNFLGFVLGLPEGRILKRTGYAMDDGKRIGRKRSRLASTAGRPSCFTKEKSR